jgi:CubicO group peptidase (beta-lactamase class C family)
MRTLLIRHLIYTLLIVVAFSSCKKEDSVEAPLTVVNPLFIAFADSLEKGLDKSEYGYSIAVYNGNKLVVNRSAGERTKSIDGAAPFTNDTRIQMASISKTITSMTALKLLQEKGIPLSDSIYKYLPTNWVKTESFKTVTFRQLLTHTSGIRFTDGSCNNGDANTYASLQAIASRDINTTKAYCYQNANFGLLRVALPIINGLIITGVMATDDANIQNAYEALVKQSIFAKKDIADASCAWKPGNALLYEYPYTGRAGFNSGNLLPRSGGLGWYLTTAEVGKVMSSLSDPADQTILPNNWKDSLLQKGYGSFTATTSKGTAYWHDGIWYLIHNNQNPQGMRSLWIKLPYENMTAVIVVNALRGPSTSPGFPVANMGIVPFVVNAFNAAIK